MAAQDGAPGGGLDRVVLAELLGRFHAAIGGGPQAARSGGGAPDPIAQWTATERGEGPPLSAIVDVLGPLRPDAVAALALGIAAELTRIHAAGAVHRRLTPSNVLLPESGPKLVYSGVPRTVDGATITDIDGSPLAIGYLTPEQVLGQSVGPETDVFALGGVLAFAASGVPPFGSDEPLSVLYRIVNEQPALGAVPASLRGLVKACLSKLPAQRPTLQTLTARATGVLKDTRGVKGRTKDVRSAVRAPMTDRRGLMQAQTADAGVLAQGVAQNQPADMLAAPDQTDTHLISDFAPTQLTSMAIPGTHRRRRRSANVAVLGTVVIGVAAAFLVRAVAEPSTASSGQPGALPVVPTATVTATVTATATTGALASAALPGVFVAGLGCAKSPWTGIAESVASSSGLVPKLGGGLVGCGGQAIAFVKTGTTAPGPSSFAWSFRLGTPAHCTLSVYVANADASSGYAHYRLSIPAPGPAIGAPVQTATTAKPIPSKIAPTKTIPTKTLIFQINQSAAKGQWVAAPELAGLSLPDGSVQLVLTDAGAYAGDDFHVTASAVRASCSPAA